MSKSVVNVKNVQKVYGKKARISRMLYEMYRSRFKKVNLLESWDHPDQEKQHY